MLFAFSHLDLGIGEDEGSTALLDNSAAKHKMAIRPQRKRRSESRQRDSNPGDDDDAMETNQQQSDVQVEGNIIKKIKSSMEEEESAESKRGYRRTRSGRQLVTFDPVAKRE